MALYDPAARPVVANHTFGAPVLTLFSGLVGTLAGWNDARVTRNALSQLSDHQLNDLGLHRGAIEEMFR